MLTNSKNRWGLISQGFHWVTALLILLAVVLGLIADDMADSPAKLRLFVAHKSVGLLVLALALLRLLWRGLTPSPQAASGISPADQGKARMGHALLYLIMIALPFSGWVLHSAANYPLKWMNLFSIPNLSFVPSSFQEPATEAHWWLFLIMAVLVLGHALMAFVHHRWHNSDVLLRILPTSRISVFFSALGFALILLFAGFYFSAQGAFYSPPASTVSAALAEAPTETQPLILPTNSEPRTSRQWQIMPDNRKLGFSGSYEGAPFKGEFRDFTVTLFFDPQQPQLSKFDVVVETSSITAYSDDFDGTLVEEDWFFVSRYPQARYQARHFEARDNGFTAFGSLYIKGIEHRVPLYFQWQTQADGSVLFSGQATVDRTLFMIGAGEWIADDTIGFSVDVQVDLHLREQSSP